MTQPPTTPYLLSVEGVEEEWIRRFQGRFDDGEIQFRDDTLDTVLILTGHLTVTASLWNVEKTVSKFQAAGIQISNRASTETTRNCSFMQKSKFQKKRFCLKFSSSGTRRIVTAHQHTRIAFGKPGRSKSVQVDCLYEIPLWEVQDDFVGYENDSEKKHCII